jgi:hypothetical protein
MVPIAEFYRTANREVFMWQEADYGSFDETHNDKEKIKSGSAVPCRICELAFKRLRLTLRYCWDCERGFCEGEHGNFTKKNGEKGPQRARCVRCGPGPD